MTRLIVWFSCGAASAVAAKSAVQIYSSTFDVEVVCCDTRPSEHSDNYRFSADVEKWIGQPIRYIRNEDYETVDDVFAKHRYMSGIRGARCTTELKKIPRLKFAAPDDIHVFGFTADEPKRIREFQKRNPELHLRFLLQELGITKDGCYRRLGIEGIVLPKMYTLFDDEDRAKFGQGGFDNNNCPGCVKASSPWYWSMIRKYFPETFQRRCEQSRAIGVRLVEIKHHVRIYLDELPMRDFKKPRKREKLSCGPECGGPAKV